MPQTALTPKDAEYIVSTYRTCPEYFVTDVLGAKPWPKQTEIIQSVFNYKLTAVKTCNAVGKSFIAARIVITYLMLYPGSIVVTTAPTWRQVTDVLWREIGTAVKQARYKLTDKEATQAGLNLASDWFAVGLSTKRPENFFGYHADNILVVVDEAGGVEEPIFRGVAAITPNVNARILYIGNPTSPSGTFYDVFTKPELGANCFTINAFETPNFTDVGIKTLDDLLKVFTPPASYSQADWTTKMNIELEKRSNPDYRALIGPSVVYSRYHEWGTDSPAWESLIMGEFPSQSEQALIPANIVKQAMNMRGRDKHTGKTYAELSGWKIPDGRPEYGLDMARFGADRTILTPTRGGWVDDMVSWNKIDLMESADRVIRLVDPFEESCLIKIDDTGNGGGTTDALNRAKRDQGIAKPYLYQVVPFNFAQASYRPQKFANFTSEIYWNLRSWFMAKAISIPDDSELYDELISRRWKINNRGLIEVESKDDFRKRTGSKSPDKADSLALAFARREVGRATELAKETSPLDEHLRETYKPITSGLQQRY